MKDESSKRLGRPTKPAQSGKRVSLGLKVSPEIKGMLDEAARKTGRSQSLEAEFRLEASFREEDLFEQLSERIYGRRLAGILLLISRVMEATGIQSAMLVSHQLTADPDRWLSVPWAFEQAVDDACRALKYLLPIEPATPPPTLDLPVIEPGNPGAELLQLFVQPGGGWSSEILRAALLGEKTRFEIDDAAWAARLADLLGPLADHAKARLKSEVRDKPSEKEQSE